MTSRELAVEYDPRQKMISHHGALSLSLFQYIHIYMCAYVRVCESVLIYEYTCVQDGSPP